MRTLSAIPTKGRVDTITRNTLSWLYKTKYDWKLFIEPQEKTTYLRLYPMLENRLVVLPENNQGLMYALGQIREYAKAHRYDLIFKLDDDVKGWYDASRKRSKIPVIEFERAIERSAFLMRTDNTVGGVSFPYSHQMFDVDEEWSSKGRFQSCYIVRTSLLYYNPNVRVFTDFSNYVHIRSLGMHVARYNYIGMDIQPVAQYAGGLQMLDRSSFYEESIKALRADFPFLRFRPVEGKKWKEEPDMRSIP